MKCHDLTAKLCSRLDEGPRESDPLATAPDSTRMGGSLFIFMFYQRCERLWPYSYCGRVLSRDGCRAARDVEDVEIDPSHLKDTWGSFFLKNENN